MAVTFKEGDRVRYTKAAQSNCLVNGDHRPHKVAAVEDVPEHRPNLDEYAGMRSSSGGGAFLAAAMTTQVEVGHHQMVTLEDGVLLSGALFELAEQGE